MHPKIPPHHNKLNWLDFEQFNDFGITTIKWNGITTRPEMKTLPFRQHRY